MAITLFGSSVIPADNGTNATTTITLTPPASMQANDLVLVYTQQRGAAVMSVGVTGGQSWTSAGTATITNASITAFFCTFNGTWGADPRFDFTVGTCTSALMLVFRPNTGKFLTPSLNVGTGNGWTPGGNTAGATAVANSGVGVALQGVDNLSVLFWSTADDNTWSLTTPNGYTAAASQYRNIAGSDQSIFYAYKALTTLTAPNGATATQTALGADTTRTPSIYFYETDPVTFEPVDPLGMTGFFGM